MGLLLEKAMAVTGARIGSVFMVEPETCQQRLDVSGAEPMLVSELYRFRVGAVRGHQNALKEGTYVDIDSSVTRAVLLERGPLLVQDIEKDPRTLKTNNPKYGTPSFMSLPIFIGGSITAILNLASKNKERSFDGNDEQVLTIMLRDICFVLENAMLQSRISEQLEMIQRHNSELEKEIAQRRQTERALAESEAKFRMLVEKSNDIIYTTDLKGQFSYVNPAAERIVGFPAADLLGRRYLSLVRPDFQEDMEEFYRRQLEEKNPSTYFEFPVIVADGSTRWIGQHVQLLADDGGPRGFQAVARDITDTKLAEEKIAALNLHLTETNTQLEAAYAWMRENRDKLIENQSREGIGFLVNREGIIKGMTESAPDYAGKTREQLLGMPITELLLADYRDDFLAELSHAWIGMGQGISVETVSGGEGARTAKVRMTRLAMGGMKLLFVALQ
jgi:PAS domain S-box-containing protein